MEKNGNRQCSGLCHKTAATTAILCAQQGSFSQSLSHLPGKKMIKSDISQKVRFTRRSILILGYIIF